MSDAKAPVPRGFFLCEDFKMNSWPDVSFYKENLWITHSL